MNNFEDEYLKEVLPFGEIGEDEYINTSDNLIYCRHCHKPRQLRYEYNNRIFIPRIMCDCQKADYDKEKSEYKQRELSNKISILRADGLQDTAYRNFIFANDDGRNFKIEIARNYVNNWNKMQENSLGFLLWEDVGTGKTFFAGCIANALLSQGVPVLMTNFAGILNTLTGLYSSDKNGCGQMAQIMV